MHPEVRTWLSGLDTKSAHQVAVAIKCLTEQGPMLGRPLVDTLRGTRMGNLKELRPGSAKRTEVRILFAFDFKRQAVLLIAGDKQGEWNKWYDRMIPVAEKRFNEHTNRLKAASGGAHGSPIV